MPCEEGIVQCLGCGDPHEEEHLVPDSGWLCHNCFATEQDQYFDEREQAVQDGQADAVEAEQYSNQDSWEEYNPDAGYDTSCEAGLEEHGLGYDETSMLSRG